jgi:hypothetical protein
MSHWYTCACEGRRDEGGPMNAKQGRRPRLFTSAAGAPVRRLGSAGKEKGFGARDLRDDDTHGEAGQWELWEVSTSDKMLQAPAMARRRRTSRRREGDEGRRRMCSFTTRSWWHCPAPRIDAHGETGSQASAAVNSDPARAVKMAGSEFASESSSGDERTTRSCSGDAAWCR